LLTPEEVARRRLTIRFLAVFDDRPRAEEFLEIIGGGSGAVGARLR